MQAHPTWQSSDRDDKKMNWNMAPEIKDPPSQFLFLHHKI